MAPAAEKPLPPGAPSMLPRSATDVCGSAAKSNAALAKVRAGFLLVGQVAPFIAGSNVRVRLDIARMLGSCELKNSSRHRVPRVMVQNHRARFAAQLCPECGSELKLFQNIC